MFGNWLNGIPKDYKPLVLVGAAVLCWSVWRYRNTVVFYNKNILSCKLSSRLHPCGGIAFFGPGGQGLFCPGAWVTD